jgi:hypothetical protein
MLYTHVTNVCFKCFICFSGVCNKCFIWMFQKYILCCRALSTSCCCWCAAVVHVPVPKACRRLHSAHPQAEQVGTGRGSAVWMRGRSSVVLGTGWVQFQTLTLVGKARRRRSCVRIHRKENCFDNKKKRENKPLTYTKGGPGPVRAVRPNRAPKIMGPKIY